MLTRLTLNLQAHTYTHTHTHTQHTHTRSRGCPVITANQALRCAARDKGDVWTLSMYKCARKVADHAPYRTTVLSSAPGSTPRRSCLRCQGPCQSSCRRRNAACKVQRHRNKSRSIPNGSAIQGHESMHGLAALLHSSSLLVLHLHSLQALGVHVVGAHCVNKLFWSASRCSAVAHKSASGLGATVGCGGSPLCILLRIVRTAVILHSQSPEKLPAAMACSSCSNRWSPTLRGPQARVLCTRSALPLLAQQQRTRTPPPVSHLAGSDVGRASTL